ncbi:peptidoglycan-binding lysin domain-containing protein [Paenibacillus algicola]|uniref:Peptidoglycan-binding lysin domain-containing protein n=1 Tax=Paenibacillus algicola TaxID=2565926 RepID=A0A4P8XHZ8_9BACL|nr:LysM peptidoglycan-binding domain-containing protein [Paenibacillus algicola]QCT01995.1 peptidoglycan-binding lysin domain-containing protein [Paenibacillus algicola]
MKIHIVKQGDTLYELSQKYGVSLAKIMDANPQLVDPDQLDIGAKIKIPAEPVTVPDGSSTSIHKHTVKQGDSLWKLSKAWGVPLKNMIEANPQLKNPNALLVGEIVNIPAPSPAGAVEKKEMEAAPDLLGKTAPGSKTYTGPKEQMTAPSLPLVPDMPEAPDMPEELEIEVEIAPEIVVKPEITVSPEVVEKTVIIEKECLPDMHPSMPACPEPYTEASEAMPHFPMPCAPGDFSQSMVNPMYGGMPAPWAPTASYSMLPEMPCGCNEGSPLSPYPMWFDGGMGHPAAYPMPYGSPMSMNAGGHEMMYAGVSEYPTASGSVYPQPHEAAQHKMQSSPMAISPDYYGGVPYGQMMWGGQAIAGAGSMYHQPMHGQQQGMVMGMPSQPCQPWSTYGADMSPLPLHGPQKDCGCHGLREEDAPSQSTIQEAASEMSEGNSVTVVRPKAAKPAAKVSKQSGRSKTTSTTSTPGKNGSGKRDRKNPWINR